MMFFHGLSDKERPHQKGVSYDENQKGSCRDSGGGFYGDMCCWDECECGYGH